jgi:Ca2+/Na+ antiporter
MILTFDWLGLVDMGVSNTFGSNVFDLLIGLAVPWFFKTLISGEAVHINSNGLMYDSVLLLGIVAVTVRRYEISFI